jgi:predicted negative regulator of RcsB-dependent stress response
MAGLWLDRRGDLLAEQGKPDLAKAAWKSSLDRLAPDDPMRAVVQLKFDTIGGGS